GGPLQAHHRDRFPGDRAVLPGWCTRPVGSLARAGCGTQCRDDRRRGMNAPVAPSRMNLAGPSHAASGNALELRGITKMFGALAAISDVTLSVKPGERRAVLGSTGGGQTPLFNCITGDFLPTAGLIRLFGEDVTAFPPYERIRRGLRRTYQISSLFTGLSVMDNVYLACRGVSRNRFSLIRPRADDALVNAAEALVEAVHLIGEKDRLVGELAYGQQRQLEIARALAGGRRAIPF